MTPKFRRPHPKKSPKGTKSQSKIIPSIFSQYGRTPVIFSWHNHHLLDMLWACVMAGNMDRKKYLKIFKEMVDNAQNILEKDSTASLRHTYISKLDKSTFSRILSPILEDDEAATYISAVRSVENMPDSRLWHDLSIAGETPENHINVLTAGVASCIDRKSQEATDVQWINALICKKFNRIKFGPAKILADQIEHYPNCKDIETVSSLIRSCEIMTHAADGTSEKDFLFEKVWAEFLQKTKCEYPPCYEFPIIKQEELFREIVDIIEDIISLFHRSLKNTNIDPRLDAAIGISIYSLSLTGELLMTPYSLWATGRIQLRTVVECLIILTFLRKKDNANLWMKYRNYGSGRTSLALSKFLDKKEIPSYIDIDRLKNLANEDAWSETIDIDLRSWANKSVRSMAMDTDLMNIYDEYYEVTSGFTHAQWTSVRDSVFTICLNPLHRYHRIPQTPEPMFSVLHDCRKICNMILDELNILYPNEISRISETPK